MKSKSKNLDFQCSACGELYSKWQGQCPGCQSWNTISEIQGANVPGSRRRLLKLSDMRVGTDLERTPTGLPFLDRLLVGGFPAGTAILLAGEPGIGKSTILFQMLLKQLKKSIYVSSEESEDQVARRFQSFDKGVGQELFLVSQAKVEAILDLMMTEKPQVLVVDSIQMTVTESVDRARGGVAAIREAAEALVSKAKELGITLWLVGHINKDGDVAGPKMLEHLVDVVLTFNMAEDHRLRFLQVQKNRYGPSGEVVLLEMSDRGLQESQAWDSFWIHRNSGPVAGCALAVTMLGSRVACIEIQALSVQSYFPSPKRSASGYDINRLHLLLAVLEKRLKIQFSNQDVYLNVVGGLRLQDPGADLAVAAALVSAYSEKMIPVGTVFSGEIGLTGEIRPVSALADRVKFADQSNLKVFYGPLFKPNRVEMSYKPVSQLSEVLAALI